MSDTAKTKVTKELMTQGMSAAGGWNRRQMDILGVKWPPKQGWKIRAVGKEITKEAADEFISLKGKKRRTKRGPLVDLPFPMDLKKSVKTCLIQFDAFFEGLDVETKRKVIPSLIYMARKAEQHCSGIKPPDARGDWNPRDSADLFTIEEAKDLIGKKTARGLTAKWMSRKAIPWPPPSNWKARLIVEIKSRFSGAI